MDDYRPNENQEYYGYVYLTSNIQTKKKYVGQRKGKPTDTKNINYFGSGVRIKKSIEKRGKYNFKKIILGVCDNAKELTECETECKLFFNVLNPLYGYNIIKDDWGFGDTFTNQPEWKKEEIKRKSSIAHKGKHSSFKGKKHTEEANRKNSEKHKGKTGRKGYKCTEETKEKLRKINLGKHHTEETKEKISESMIGRNSWMKGKTQSQETINKKRESRKGYKHTEETKQKIKKSNEGRKCLEETKNKISNTMIEKGTSRGKNHPMFGKHHNKQIREKISKTIFGSKWMHFDLIQITKQVKPQEFEDYLNIGWEFGRKKY